ncbi:MAG: hypothetical protein RIB84_08150 [Sneathiellaceae bacterium]
MAQHSSNSPARLHAVSRPHHSHTNNGRPAARLLAAFLLVPLAATIATAEAAEPPPGLTVEECRILLRQSTSASAAYVPGVSASGQPVASADLPPDPGVSADGTASTAFDTVEIKLLGTVDPIAGTGVGTELRPGTLTVNTRTGEVLLDGKPLNSNDSANIASYCAALEKRENR